jgi:thiamine-phosphate pyrophosphorylase
MPNVQSQATQRRKLMALTRRIRPALARNRSALPTSWLLTDPVRTPDPIRIARRLPRGWGLIYRHFGATDRLVVADALSRIARRRELVFLIGADPELACAVRAHGVHWPERLAIRRRSQRRFPIETAAAHSARALRKCAASGLDACFLSPVYPSASPSAGRALGLRRFRLLAKGSPLPVFGLGGIDEKGLQALVVPQPRQLAGWAAIAAIHEAWGNRGSG